ncbi:MAG: hypothetical protein AAFQ01_00570, partial [Bacteroidota bacterium]
LQALFDFLHRLFVRYTALCKADPGMPVPVQHRRLVVIPTGKHQLIPGEGSYEVQVTYQNIVHSGKLHITGNDLTLEAPTLSAPITEEASLYIAFTKHRSQ